MNKSVQTKSPETQSSSQAQKKTSSIVPERNAMKKLMVYVLLLIAAGLLSACNTSEDQVPQVDPEVITIEADKPIVNPDFASAEIIDLEENEDVQSEVPTEVLSKFLSTQSISSLGTRVVSQTKTTSRGRWTYYRYPSLQSECTYTVRIVPHYGDPDLYSFASPGNRRIARSTNGAGRVDQLTYTHKVLRYGERHVFLNIYGYSASKYTLEVYRKCATAKPKITSVSPSQPIAKSARQWITVNGSNFGSSVTAYMTYAGRSYTIPQNRTRRESASRVKLYVGLGTVAGRWSVKIRSNGQTSNTAYFNTKATTPAPSSNTYALPYRPNTRVNITQGYNGGFSHGGRYAMDSANIGGSGIITAARSGKVIQTFNYGYNLHPRNGCVYRPSNNNFGRAIVIQHSDGTTAWYAHLSSIKVRNGQTVTQGQDIGVIGNTGCSTGTHLHFEVTRNSGYNSGTLKVNFVEVSTPITGRTYTAR